MSYGLSEQSKEGPSVRFSFDWLFCSETSDKGHSERGEISQQRTTISLTNRVPNVSIIHYTLPLSKALMAHFLQGQFSLHPGPSLHPPEHVEEELWDP